VSALTLDQARSASIVDMVLLACWEYTMPDGRKVVQWVKGIVTGAAYYSTVKRQQELVLPCRWWDQEEQRPVDEPWPVTRDRALYKYRAIAGQVPREGVWFIVGTEEQRAALAA
jgi:hypothetical protein